MDEAKMSPQREYLYYGPMSAILHSVYPLQESFLIYPQRVGVRLVLALAAVGLQLILPQGVIPNFVVRHRAHGKPHYKIFLACKMKKEGESVQDARDQLRRYFEQAGEEMEEHGGSEAYGLLTIGTKWEVYKISLAKGVMETLSTGQDFSGDDAVKLLHHLKQFAASPALLPPLAVPTPPGADVSIGDVSA
jgi:hypothetical protein